MSMNRVTLVGRLVRDPEIRTTSTGKNVAEFSLAVQKRTKPSDPNQPDADFFRCKAWNQQADFLGSYAAKGRMVGLEGRLESRRYQDKDGVQREVIEIVCDHVALLDRPREEAAPTPEPVATKKAVAAAGVGKGRAKAASVGEYDPFAD